MSKFVSMWKYFRDELRFPLIQDVGPLAQLAQGGGDVLDEVRELVYWLRRQLNPETCEDAYVANHARSRVIVRGPHETWSAFRTRVAQAYHFHWLAGKHNGMPQILELMGYPGASLINWRGQDPEKWAEFWCSLLPPADQEFRLQDYDQLFWILNEYKPARSRLVSLRFEHQVETDPPAAVGLLVATGSRFSVMFGCDPRIRPGIGARGAGRAGVRPADSDLWLLPFVWPGNAAGGGGNAAWGAPGCHVRLLPRVRPGNAAHGCGLQAGGAPPHIHHCRESGHPGNTDLHRGGCDPALPANHRSDVTWLNLKAWH